MRPEELAYNHGFRVTKEGKLYHTSGREYKTHFSQGKLRFCVRKNRKTTTIYTARLQAFLKYGSQLYEYNLITHKNGNPLDSSWDNILLGKGSEIITDELLSMPKTKRAYYLGYRVNEAGVLFLNGVEARYRVSKFGYKMFDIPFKEKKMDQVFVHRLQAFQKYGEKLFKEDCVRHLNGNKLENSYENIAIGSFKQNIDDIPLEVKAQQYLKVAHSQIKYPVPLRNKLRKLHHKGERICDLSRKFNMPYTAVRFILQDSIV